MTIRTAIESDYLQLKSLFTEENRFHADLVPKYIQMTNDILKREELQEFLANTDSNIFVYEKNTELLGAIIISIREEKEDRWKKSRVIGYIDDLIVKSSARRNGIGKQLVAAARSWFFAQSIHNVELNVWETNTGSYQFYNALGFHTVQRRMMLSI